MPDRCHMNAYLVRSSGLKLAFYIGKSARGRFKSLNDLVVGNGISRLTPRVGDNRHFFAVNGMTTNGSVNSSAIVLHVTDNDSVIDTADIVSFELCRKRNVSIIVFGNHKQSRRILIYSMDDSGANHAANTRKRVATMIKQSVDQRSGIYTRSGVNYHSLRLVDHDNILVLIHYVKGNIFSDRLIGYRLRELYFNYITRAELVVFADRLSLDSNGATLNKLCRQRARYIRPKGNKSVYSLAHVTVRNLKRHHVSLGLLLNTIIHQFLHFCHHSRLYRHSLPQPLSLWRSFELWIPLQDQLSSKEPKSRLQR